MVQNESAGRAEENKTLDIVEFADGDVKRPNKVQWFIPFDFSQMSSCRCCPPITSLHSLFAGHCMRSPALTLWQFFCGSSVAPVREIYKWSRVEID